MKINPTYMPLLEPPCLFDIDIFFKQHLIGKVRVLTKNKDIQLTKVLIMIDQIINPTCSRLSNLIEGCKWLPKTGWTSSNTSILPKTGAIAHPAYPPLM